MTISNAEIFLYFINLFKIEKKLTVLLCVIDINVKNLNSKVKSLRRFSTLI